MKKIISVLVVFLLLASCTSKKTPELTDQIKNGLRNDAKEFMESLKSVLQKEIQTNGILAAVSVCSDTAQLMTVNYGLNKGIYIKRVSFKNRNPFNNPDGFETKVLKHFNYLSSVNKITDTTEIFELIIENDVATVRYMKPILIQAPCLNCHGSESQIAKDVKEVISNKYPEDKATGYYIDDLRGAVSIKKTL